MPAEPAASGSATLPAGARLIYGALVAALLPLLLARQWWRGRQLPEFRAHWRERVARYAGEPAAVLPSPVRNERPRRIWIHAVSLGETQASLPLLQALHRDWPQAELLLTHMTPTGRAAGAAFALPGLRQAYLPYDFPGAMARFLDHFRPDLGILMETEVWPGLIAAAGPRQIPLLLANARLSARSLAGYRRAGAFGRAVFAGLELCAAQTAEDAGRLASAGARRVEVTGNLKFDMTPATGEESLGRHFRERWGGRPVWLAASTREGEEALLLEVLPRLAAHILLVLVPRHPQRFDEVAALAVARGLPIQRRSADQPVAAGTRVVLGDSVGELGAYYRSADLAFVGGSLLPLGGQNLLEACARGCPVLLGPHTFNFELAAGQAVAAGAAVRVTDARDLADQVATLLADGAAREAMGRAGQAFVARHRGATAHTVTLIGHIWAERIEAQTSVRS